MITLDNMYVVQKKNGAVILDGAFGTELARYGLPNGITPENWNITHPDEVSAVSRSYTDAGAHIVLTNSFGGSSFKLHKAGEKMSAQDINEYAARNARAGAGDTASVFGSVGPTGEFLAPLGTVTEAKMTDVFTEQINGLIKGGVDGIVIETMMDLGEALCALRAAKSCAPSLLTVVSMTFDKGQKGYATMMGVTPAEAARTLTEEGADIIGTNCGNGIDNMCEIIAMLADNTHLPLWAKPNAGMPVLREGKTVFPAEPAEMAEKTPALIKAGATCVGGCCGTTPEHIKAMVAAAKAFATE